MIVLSWNGRDLLRTCLDAIYHPELEIIVVDNGSVDGSATMVRHEYPEIRLLPLATNRGFAGGVNAGLYVARGEYLALFNNDATAPPTFFHHLADQLDRRPQLGAAAGVLVFDHQPQLVASAGINVYNDGVALDAFMLTAKADLPTTPQPIWGASGGAVMYRRQALADVGIFDEGYFAYLEDVDLAWRLRWRGWATELVPEAQARHIYSATGGEGSPLKRWLLARNRWRVLLRCWPQQLLHKHVTTIARYDLLACTQSALQGHWTTINGRIAAWREYRSLRTQHQLLHQRFSTSTAELEPWLLPARSVQTIRYTASALQKVLNARKNLSPKREVL